MRIRRLEVIRLHILLSDWYASHRLGNPGISGERGYAYARKFSCKSFLFKLCYSVLALTWINESNWWNHEARCPSCGTWESLMGFVFLYVEVLKRGSFSNCTLKLSYLVRHHHRRESKTLLIASLLHWYVLSSGAFGKKVHCQKMDFTFIQIISTTRIPLYISQIWCPQVAHSKIRLDIASAFSFKPTK